MGRRTSVGLLTLSVNDQPASVSCDIGIGFYLQRISSGCTFLTQFRSIHKMNIIG